MKTYKQLIIETLSNDIESRYRDAAQKGLIKSSLAIHDHPMFSRINSKMGAWLGKSGTFYHTDKPDQEHYEVANIALHGPEYTKTHPYKYDKDKTKNKKAMLAFEQSLSNGMGRYFRMDDFIHVQSYHPFSEAQKKTILKDAYHSNYFELAGKDIDNDIEEATNKGSKGTYLDRVRRLLDAHETISEAEHFIKQYSRWGIISPEHGIVYGDKTVKGKPVYEADRHDNLARDLGLNIGDFAEFYQHSGHGEGPYLGLRTIGEKSAKLAHDYFDQLPHVRNGDVIHEHYIKKTTGKYTDYYHSREHSSNGKRYQIKNNLAKIIGEKPEF